MGRMQAMKHYIQWARLSGCVSPKFTVGRIDTIWSIEETKRRRWFYPKARISSLQLTLSNLVYLKRLVSYKRLKLSVYIFGFLWQKGAVAVDGDGDGDFIQSKSVLCILR